MRLPAMTASRVFTPAMARGRAPGTDALALMGAEGVNPAGLEDVLSGIANVGGAIASKLPCLALNCGLNVLSCIYCATNPVCWLTCAGPGAIQCISDCLSD